MMLFAPQGCDASEDGSDPAQEEIVKQFSSIYEPSGLLALPGGDILIIEDEAAQPISLLKLKADGRALRPSYNTSATTLAVKGNPTLGRLEDLEGVAGDDAGHLYVVTSHSKTSKRKLPGSRKKLIRFKLSGSSITESVVINSLKKNVLKKYKNIRTAISGNKADLNIEALSYHRRNHQLMIGLRAPVIDDDAVIVIVENPDQAFSRNEKLRLSTKLIRLNLDKGGIRAIAYDDFLKGYLILSRREDKKDKAFKIWLWDGKEGHKPIRIRFNSDLSLDNAEGITPIRTNTFHGLLIAFDDGNRLSRKGGHYALLSYEQLKIGRKNKSYK